MQYSDRQLAKAAIKAVGFIAALTSPSSEILRVAFAMVLNGDKDLEAQLKVLTKEVNEELQAEVAGNATPLPGGQRIEAEKTGNPGYDWQGPAERLMD